MKIKRPISSFKNIYSIFSSIAGNHNGLINKKIIQPPASDKGIEFIAMTADFPNYMRELGKEHNFSYHLSGYGVNREEALIRLIGEATERFSAIYSSGFLDKNIIFKSINQLEETLEEHTDINLINVFPDNGNSFIEKILPTDVIGWYKALNLLTGKFTYVPAQMFFLDYNDKNHNEKRYTLSFSTGTATHTDFEKAIINALVEYLQIDSFILSWYTDLLKFPKVTLDKKMTEFLSSVNLLSDDFDYLILDLSMDKPLNIFGVFIISDSYPYITFGVQGGFEPYHTLYRGIMEALTIRQYAFSAPLYDEKNYLSSQNEDESFLNLDTNVLYWASDIDLEQRLHYIYNKIEGEKCISEYINNEQNSLEIMVDYLKKHGMTPSIVDITSPEVDVTALCTVRILIPELLPMCLPSKPISEHPRFKEYGGVKYEYPHPMP